ECRVLAADCLFPRVTQKNPQSYPHLSSGLPSLVLSLTQRPCGFAAGGLTGCANPARLQRRISDLPGAQQQRRILRFDPAADDLFHDLLHSDLKALAVFQHSHLNARRVLRFEGAPMEDAEQAVAQCWSTAGFAVGLQMATSSSLIGQLQEP